MPAHLCTLAEGDYHLGVGALANSLYSHGYRGVVWVGYRGALPPWAARASERDRWHELTPTPDLALRFIVVDTTAHLTNYKPAFLLDLWTNFCPEAERLFYFDPDIVIKCPWRFFEDWAGYGVALVEDVNSPLPESHPRREAWKRCLRQRNRALQRELSLYVNGGFVGLHRAQRGFLQSWFDAMTLVAEEVGGLEHSMFSFRPDQASEAHPFSKTDQDALNIAIMTSREPVSLMGSEGMDFKPGGWTMSHALGAEKPWRKRFLRAALQGRPPTPADRGFWENASGPIAASPAHIVARQQRRLRWAAALGRFYRSVGR